MIPYTIHSFVPSIFRLQTLVPPGYKTISISMFLSAILAIHLISIHRSPFHGLLLLLKFPRTCFLLISFVPFCNILGINIVMLYISMLSSHSLSCIKLLLDEDPLRLQSTLDHYREMLAGLPATILILKNASSKCAPRLTTPRKEQKKDMYVFNIVNDFIAQRKVVLGMPFFLTIEIQNSLVNGFHQSFSF